MANTKKDFEDKKTRASISITQKHKNAFYEKCALLKLCPSNVVEELIIVFIQNSRTVNKL